MLSTKINVPCSKKESWKPHYTCGTAPYTCLMKPSGLDLKTCLRIYADNKHFLKMLAVQIIEKKNTNVVLRNESVSRVWKNIYDPFKLQSYHDIIYDAFTIHNITLWLVQNNHHWSKRSSWCNNTWRKSKFISFHLRKFSAKHALEQKSVYPTERKKVKSLIYYTCRNASCNCFIRPAGLLPWNMSPKLYADNKHHLKCISTSFEINLSKVNC